MFFALIGANVHIDAIRADTFIYVVLYILTRTLGKRWGTKLGTKLANQDLKIRRCLPNLMLPQAGVAAVEAAYVAIVLKNGDDVVNVILPALIFFEVVGVILAEKTLIQWKSWTVGEEAFLQLPSATKPAKQPASVIQLGRILSNEVIKIPLNSTTKEGIILELLELLKNAGKVSDTDHVLRDIMAREKLMSTGIGDGIAIPHGKTSGITEVLCAFGVKLGGVDFKSIDGVSADIFFLIVSPEDDQAVHLKFLATISHLLQSNQNRQRIREFSSSQDAMAFFAIVDEAEISE
jgi:fructose-specific phosphotransferase system IIA component